MRAVEWSRLLVVGDGAVARALKAALPDEVLHWHRRSAGGIPSCDAAIIAVNDHAIVQVARRVAEAAAAPVLLHTAGGLSGKIMAGLSPAVGLCHPLRALRGPVESFAGTVFGVEGDAAAVAVAEQIVKYLDGVSLRLVAEQLPRYHAAAALAGNHTVALVASAADELAALGLGRKQAEAALAGLLGSAAENIAELGAAAGLTGAVARGDEAAVERHLGALSPMARRLYVATLPALVELARAGGRIDDESAARLLRLVAD